MNERDWFQVPLDYRGLYKQYLELCEERKRLQAKLDRTTELATLWGKPGGDCPFSLMGKEGHPCEWTDSVEAEDPELCQPQTDCPKCIEKHIEGGE